MILLQLFYSSNSLEKILTNQRLIKRYYTKFHQKLSNRLSELRTVQNLAEISNDPPPRRHKLSREYSDCWGIDISRNFRIIIKPVGNFNMDDLTSINKIEIIDLEDYH